jgi:hypothetical protein
MAQVAVDRRSDSPTRRPASVSEVNESAHGYSARADRATSALGAIATYIPTEITVIYVAVLAAIATSDVTTMTGQWVTLWVTMALCPIVVWAVYAAKVRSGQGRLPVKWAEWPKLEMVFSTVAFAAWAFAMPESPFVEFDWYKPALSGIAVLVVQTSLGLLAGVFGREIDAGDPRPNGPAGGGKPEAAPIDNDSVLVGTVAT